jgi:hypothetical protein
LTSARSAREVAIEAAQIRMRPILVRLHLRRAAARDRDRRCRRDAPGAGHRPLLRHDRTIFGLIVTPVFHVVAGTLARS